MQRRNSVIVFLGSLWNFGVHTRSAPGRNMEHFLVVVGTKLHLLFISLCVEQSRALLAHSRAAAALKMNLAGGKPVEDVRCFLYELGQGMTSE